jgi:hypothetical protein
MSQIAELIGYFFALFAASMAVAWLVASLKLGAKRCPEPAAGSALKMRGEGGMYRTRVIETRGPFWVLAAPLMRDYYVPMHVGEKLTIEYPMDGGVLFFRSVVRARDIETHTLIIDRPEGGRKTERRQEKRLVGAGLGPISLDGAQAVLVNLSQGGAKVSTPKRIQIGERVGIQLPWNPEPVHGWVLETVPSVRSEVEARIRFEEPATLPVGQSETAPV